MINLIEEVDVTYVTLILELERATTLYERRGDGKSRYVTDGGWFPSWRNSATRLQKLAVANDFNSYVFGTTAYTESNQLKICRTPYIRNGLMRDIFILVLRDFCEIIKKSIHDCRKGVLA